MSNSAPAFDIFKLGHRDRLEFGEDGLYADRWSVFSRCGCSVEYLSNLLYLVREKFVEGPAEIWW